MRLKELRKTRGAAERVIPLFLEWLLADEEYGIVWLEPADDISRELREEVIGLFQQKCQDVNAWESVRDKGFERMLAPSKNGLEDPIFSSVVYSAAAMAHFFRQGPAVARTIQYADTARRAAAMAFCAADPSIRILAVHQVQGEKIDELHKQV